MKTTRYSSVKVLTIILFICFASAVKAQTIIPGETPVTYNVSASGAFEYSIPLRIPPGIKNLVPELAINYNSQGGNGLLGVGWSLSGLSAITRGRPTIYHDNNMGPVDFNGDKYFIDGQRMFFTGSVYYTEIKNFANIQSFGTAGNGPSYFIVEYPNGITYYYGNSFSSKMLAQGKADVLQWAVNRIEDKWGNYIEFIYDSDPVAGTYRIEEITYGDNDNPLYPPTAGTTNPVKVKFVYGTRIDQNTHYIAGSQVNSDKVLTDVYAEFSNGDIANHYVLTYDASILSRLIKIQEYRTTDDALPPIEINWGMQNGANTISTIIPVLSNVDVITGDFNGDGFYDFVKYYTGSGGLVYPFLNDKNGSFVQQNSMNVPPGTLTTGVSKETVPSNKLVFDYDGDGMDDLLIISYGGSVGGITMTMYLYRANGTTPTPFDNPDIIYHTANFDANNTNFHSLTHIVPGDYDGDGKSELLIVQPYQFHNTNSVTDYGFWLVGQEYCTTSCLNNHPGVCLHQGGDKINHFAGHIDGVSSLDYDGDGRDEFMVTHELSVAPGPISYLYNLKLNYDPVTLKPSLDFSGGWPHNLLCTSTWPHTYTKNWWGDYNGDGKTDVLTYFLGTQIRTWNLAYSNGVYNSYTNYFQIQSPHPLSTLDINGPVNSGLPNPPPYFSYHTGDFNGDGMDDIIELKFITTTSSSYKLYYSTGNSFIEQTGTLPINAIYYNVSIGDFNGDGQVDLLSHPSGQGVVKTVSFDPNSRNLTVTSIEHAGKTIDIEYTTAAQDTDYDELTTPNSYFLNRTLPIKVAKRLSDNFRLDNEYIYKGIVYNNYGLRWRGFQEFEVENNEGQKTYQYYELFTDISYLKKTVMHDALGSLPYAVETRYKQIDVPGGANDRSHIIINYPEFVIDYTNGEIAQKVINTGSTSPTSVFYNFGSLASEEEHSYDHAGDINQLTTRTYTYDLGAPFINRGKPISITKYQEMDPTGMGNNSITSTTDYVYNSYGKISYEIDNPSLPNPITTFYGYNATYGNRQLLNISPSGPGTTNDITWYTFTDDGKFLIKERSSAYDYTRLYDYGTTVQLDASWGNVLKETNYKGFETEFEYDLLNRVVKETDVNTGVEKNTVYEWASSNPHNTTNTEEKFAETTTIAANNTNNSYTTTIYDVYNRVIREAHSSFNGDDIYQDMTYTDNGLMHTSTTPYPATNPALAKTITYTYDDYNREILKTNSNGPSIATAYSIVNGLLETTVTNQTTGKSKTSVTCGSVLRKVYGNNENIEYTYHGNGTTAIVTSNGKDFENQLDAKGRVVSRTEPNTGTETYEYDGLNRMTKKTYATGIAFEYEYDMMSRLVKKTEVGQTNSYIYNYYNTNNSPQTGMLTYQIAPNGNRIDYTFNAAGQLTEMVEQGAINCTTKYTYDSDGRMLTQEYPTEDEVTYYYNNQGALEKISLTASPVSGIPTQDLWQITDKNHLGQITETYNFNSSNVNLYKNTRTYDIHGYPVQRKTENLSTLVNVADMGYSYNANTANLTSRTDNTRGFSETFTYDTDFDRLLTVTPAGAGNNALALSMGYDDDGNITKKDDVTATVVNWVYDDYALKLMPQPATSTPAWAVPQATQDVSYTSFQKVETITEAGINEASFEYDANEQRVFCEYEDLGTSNLMKTKYYANNYERVVDPVSGTTTDICYVETHGKSVALLYHNVSGTGTNATVYYPVTDQLGSITHLLDNQGTTMNGVVEERSYDAWGRLRDPADWAALTNTNSLGWKIDRGYTGQEHVWSNVQSLSVHYNNNIINMNGRLYDPLVGRMFSPDPVITDIASSQDYNKYSYARNNPLKYTDPTGNSPVMTGMSAVPIPDPTWQQNVGALLLIVSSGVGNMVGGAILGSFTPEAASNIFNMGLVRGAQYSASGALYNSGSALYNGRPNAIEAGIKGGITGFVTGFALGTYTQAMMNKNAGLPVVSGKIVYKQKATGSDFGEIDFKATAYYDGSQQAAEDTKLAKKRMAEEIGLSEGDLGINKITSEPPENYALTTKGWYVNLRDYSIVGGETGVSSRGGVKVSLSPYVIHSDPITFKAIAGHEAVHVRDIYKFKYQKDNWNFIFGNANRERFKEYTEIRAYQYQYKTYIEAGRYYNAHRTLLQLNKYLR